MNNKPEHLSRFERTVSSGCEWTLPAKEWVALGLAEGFAYVRSGPATKELPRGAALLSPPRSSPTLLASTLGAVKVWGVALRASSLTGFLSLIEAQCLEEQVARRCSPFMVLAPDHPLALRLTAICTQESPVTLVNRLEFLHAFSETLAPFFTEALAKEHAEPQDATARLRDFINGMPESELADLSLPRLAKDMHCCLRHVSRLFAEVCGSNFRTYIAELRLKKSCILLGNPKLKIIDVAAESGHGSLASFNYRFKKRFSMTPTAWREQLANGQRPQAGPGARRRALAPSSGPRVPC